MGIKIRKIVLAYAAGQDAANSYMRKSGQGGQPWTEEAFAIAARATNLVLGPELVFDPDEIVELR